MRFVVAALVACLILTCDLNVSSFQQTSQQLSQQTSAFERTISRNETAARLVPLVELFVASVQAIEQASAHAELAPAVAMTDDTTAAAPPQRSASDQFCHALREAAESSGIPVPFFARLLWQESRFRSNEVSHAGAQGVAQFMPDTAAEVGLDDPFDPMKALPASAKLLRKLRDDFGNLGLAAAAYNAGAGRIQKWLSKESTLPRETRDYVRIITGTDAEDWIEDAEKLAIRIDLPREAPCEGVGGLSKTKDVAFVPASPTASMLAMIRKAEARISSRARKHFAMLLKRNTRGHGVAKAGKARSMIAARSTKGAKSRAIRLASRERPSS